MTQWKDPRLPDPNVMKKYRNTVRHSSKYNVAKDKADRTYKGVVYDSVMEMKYFRDVIEPQYESGWIKYYERQKSYVLLNNFRRNGQFIYGITYVADFYVEYINDTIEVIDVKGCPDDVAKMKRKLFWQIYPDIDYRWVTYNKAHGGWVDYDELQKLKRAEKKEKKKKSTQDEQA